MYKVQSIPVIFGNRKQTFGFRVISDHNGVRLKLHNYEDKVDGKVVGVYSEFAPDSLNTVKRADVKIRQDVLDEVRHKFIDMLNEGVA